MVHIELTPDILDNGEKKMKYLIFSKMMVICLFRIEPPTPVTRASPSWAWPRSRVRPAAGGQVRDTPRPTTFPPITLQKIKWESNS